MKVYYNEFDPFSAEWLKNLISAGHLPKGDVDSRDMREVKPSEVSCYGQRHWFCGIGGWPLALKMAGWGDRPIDTGSCPCQSFSCAGKGKGFSDQRDLWPVFFSLIRSLRPECVIGEQVAAAIKFGWLDRIFDEMGNEGYTCGAAVLPACSVGAPHIRARLYWVARRLDDPEGARRGVLYSKDEWEAAGGINPSSNASGVHGGEDGRNKRGSESGGGRVASGCGEGGGMADDDDEGQQVRRQGRGQQDGESGFTSNGPWSNSVLIPCTDGKARRIGRSVFPLVNGIPRELGRGIPALRKQARSASRNRIGRLKGYGNAIVPYLAAQFISAFMRVEAREAQGEK